MDEKFNFDEFSRSAMEKLKRGEPLTGTKGVFTPLLKMFLEASLEGEALEHTEETKAEKNRRNGKSRKTMKSDLGKFQLETPRDRNGTFEPQTVPKRQVVIASDIDKKIIGLYGLGMSYSDIQNHLREMYDFEVSDGTLNSITDSILPEIRDWQSRPLECVYPVIWLDAMYYRVREDGRVQSKAIYSVLAVNMDGQKEILGIYFGDSESSSFWRQVLNDLQSRGLEDIFIACIDNLAGFADAIEDYFPKTEVQLCLVHQMRNSAKFVTYKDLRAVMKDLKLIYQSPTEQKGKDALEQAREKWSRKYPAVFRSWDKNWDRLSNIYKYSPALKRLMYTTNPIESYHRMIRKVTKTKGAFPSENALIKLIYLAIMNAHTKWNGQIYSWAPIRNDLNAYFSDRIK